MSLTYKGNYCCKEMKYCHKKLALFYFDGSVAHLNVYSTNRTDYIEETIHYCPFCGKKIKINIPPSDTYVFDPNIDTTETKEVK